MDPNDFFGRAPDGVWEVEVERWLASRPESERLDFLTRVLVLQQRHRLGIGQWLALAEAALDDKRSFEALLAFGLGCSDASSVRPWLIVAARRLGCRRLVHRLAEHEQSHPLEVARAVYWLPSLAQSPGELEVIRRYLSERRRDE